MNLIQLLTHSSNLNLLARSLLDKKNKDYSKEDDVHANFRRVAKLCELLEVDVSKPHGVLQFMILWKIQRWFRVINSGLPPVNENHENAAVDLHNYEDLLYTLLIDNEQK